MGVLESFRPEIARPADYRWVEAGRIVRHQRALILSSPDYGSRAIWHQDHHVRALIRLMAKTNSFSIAPHRDDIRDGDEQYLAVADLKADSDNTRIKHTMECLLLGDASNGEIEAYLGWPAGIVHLFHECCFDVRSRLSKPLVIQDMFFPPTMCQGGAPSGVATERIIAYLAGHDMFFRYRTAQVDEEGVQQIMVRIQNNLMANQALSAVLRRSFSYDSTERAIDQLHQHILVRTREDLSRSSGSDPIVSHIESGMKALTSSMMPKVMSEKDTEGNNGRVAVTAARNHIQEVIDR